MEGRVGWTTRDRVVLLPLWALPTHRTTLGHVLRLAPWRLGTSAPHGRFTSADPEYEAAAGLLYTPAA